MADTLVAERARLTDLIVREVSAVLPSKPLDETSRIARSLIATVHGHCSFAVMGEADPLDLALARVIESLRANRFGYVEHCAITLDKAHQVAGMAPHELRAGGNLCPVKRITLLGQQRRHAFGKRHDRAQRVHHLIGKHAREMVPGIGLDGAEFLSNDLHRNEAPTCAIGMREECGAGQGGPPVGQT